MTSNDDPESPAHNDTSEDKSSPTPNPDHAWKILALVNEWIRHADAKATATLAFTGALGTLLYNLVKSQKDTPVLLDIFVVLTSCLLLAAAVQAGRTLYPRTKDPEAEPEVNRVFFGAISKHFDGKRPEYRDVLRTLTEDPHELIRDLADQIHVNARIATTKNTHASWAVMFVLGAGAGLALVAILVSN